MIGDGRKRRCTVCAKNVYDLSSMTRAEAEEFVRAHEDTPVCVTFRRRADGTMLTADCPVGAERRRVRFAAIGVVLTGVAAAVAAVLGLRRPDSTTHAPRFAEHARHQRARPAKQAFILDDAAVICPRPDRDGDCGIAHLFGEPRRPAPGSRTIGCLCQPGDPLCSCL
jgi:hypothetical protein